MLALYIFLGIIGLGLVVIVHEAGHFLAARAVGITVEVFSVGWGKKMFGIVRGDTEYRISWIPLGGFVKMKGETDYIKAVEEGLDQVETTSDSFFGAAPWKRIIVAMAGPAMNIVFALLVFMIINLSGVSQFSYTNRIVLADDYPSLTRFGEGTPSPAALAGLETGDVIVAVEGVETRNFNDIEKWISFRALDRVSLDVLRNGESIELEARLDLDEETGAGILGILEYIEPVVANLSDPESAALEPGDLILAINGREITQRWDVAMALRDIEVQAGQTLARVQVLRDGQELSLMHPLTYRPEDDTLLLGVFFQGREYEYRSEGLFEAIADSWRDIGYILSGTVRGLGLMFRGLNPLNILSGPVKITYVVGEVTARSLSVSIGQGLQVFFEMLSLLSVALVIGNLLPIPVLDGGQIVISLAEIIKRSPIKPVAFSRYQAVGAVIVFVLIAFILFGDIIFVFNQ